MYKIIKVAVLENYKLKLEFNDGQRGTSDVSHLVGKGVFALWEDYSEFQKVKIGSSGELMWSGKVDLCPDALYLKITNQKPESLFPKLERRVDYA